MRINCKQTVAKLFSFYGALVVLLASIMILFSFSTGFAPTKLSDSDLADVEAQSLLSIIHYTGLYATNAAEGTPVDFRGDTYRTGSQDVLRVKLGLDIDVNAHIDSFKMGYYDNGSATGWDQDTTNQFLGTSDRNTALTFKGLYIDFGFDNLTNATTRKLNYIEIGSMTASGQVTGSLNTTTSLVYGGTGTNNGVLMRQTASGRRIITFPNTLLGFVFATKYRYDPGGGDPGPMLEGIFQKLPQYNSDTVHSP